MRMWRCAGVECGGAGPGMKSSELSTQPATGRRTWFPLKMFFYFPSEKIKGGPDKGTRDRGEPIPVQVECRWLPELPSLARGSMLLYQK